MTRFTALAGLAVLWIADPAKAQSVKLYSEFRRIGPEGRIVDPDDGGRPREILSPAVARNAYISFFMAVEAPPSGSFTLYVSENPEGGIKPTLYRVEYSKFGQHVLPDKLTKVPLPFVSPVSGLNWLQRHHAFWLDIWVPPNAPIRRMRVEVQMAYGTSWFIYPMEFRVQSIVIPSFDKPSGSLAAPAAPAQDTAALAMLNYICNRSEPGSESVESVRHFIARNASQDVALARALEKIHGRQALEAGILHILATVDPKTLCNTKPSAFTLGYEQAERYLGIRDFLYRLAVK